MANWFYDVLPAELQRRVYAHVLGQRLGGRPALLWLYQYEYRPDRSRATKLANVHLLGGLTRQHFDGHRPTRQLVEAEYARLRNLNS